MFLKVNLTTIIIMMVMVMMMMMMMLIVGLKGAVSFLTVHELG